MTASHSARGFTLLELLAAITVLGLLATLLFSSLHFGVRVWRVGDRGLDRFAELETAAALMRRTLTAATVRLPAGDAESEQGTSFEGVHDALRFVGPSPAEPLPGGFYEMTFAVVGPDDRRRLVFTAVPAEASESAERQAQSMVVLIAGVREIQFAYYGTSEDNSEPSWYDRWVDQLRLPELISVRIEFPPGDRRVWPQLIAAPMLGIREEQ